MITQGESSCLHRKSGYCALANQCDYYRDKGLWDYNFKVKFNTNEDDYYFRIPLATFAANYEQEGGACAIFVEYLDANLDDSQFIIFGGMFFQSVYAQYTQFGQNAVQVDLYINKNAERDETYLGNQAYTQAPSTNVFQVANATVHADTNTEKNGLPTFGAQIQGITDPNPYFLLDFTADHTIVWSYNCNTTGIG